MRQLTAGSLFSGIGGIDLAFSLAGFNILFQVEIDTFCQKVLAKHGPTYWPDAKIHADVCDMGGHNLPSVDVLFGGFPCQSISNAGKREGIRDGAASGLWSEFKRIISELRPRVVFLENVAAITSRDGVKVIGDLASLGYDARWGVISASDAGAPHQRDRWFCVGYTDCRGLGEPKRPPEFCNDGTRGDSPDNKVGGDILHTPERDGEMGHTYGERREEYDVITESGQKRFISRGSPQTTETVGHTYGDNRQNNNFATVTRESPRRPDKGFVQSGVESRGNETQSSMGRTINGLSVRLDSAGLMAHKWPAAPHQEQGAYEASRMAPGDGHTIDRIRALGNAVVPQCIYPIAVEIVQLLT